MTESLSLHQIASRHEAATRVLTDFEADMPSLTEVWRLQTSALADIPALSTEVSRLASELQSTRLDRANILAAAQATLAARADGEPDPLSYLRDELDQAANERRSA